MPRLAYDQGTLLLGGCGRAETLPPFFEWDDRIPAWRCHAVRLVEARQRLRERFGDAFEDAVPEPPAVAWPAPDLPELRPEQRQALEAWTAAGRRGVVVLPTGAGKTVLALAAMREAGVATLVVAPVRDLMYQWHRRIQAHLGLDAGIVGDGLRNLRPVTVTTYDSAWIHAASLGDRFGLIIFDEVHHLPGRSTREAALLHAAPLRLGLTATPERADGRHLDLDLLVGPVVFRLEAAALKGKALADYRIVRIPVALSPDEQAAYDEAGRTIREFMALRRREDANFDWRALLADTGRDPAARAAQRAHARRAAIEDRAEEKLRVLEDLFRLHIGERVIVFAGTNRMAMDVSRRFLVPTLLNHSRKRERLEVLQGFADGRFPVLVANQVLDEGVDVPEAKVAVVIGGQASARQAQQRLGRILRRSGAQPATLYEVVCAETKENERSRSRRRSEAYAGAKQFRIAEGERLAYGRPRHRRV